jgi:exopolysaccharide production protein ExoZ
MKALSTTLPWLVLSQRLQAASSVHRDELLSVQRLRGLVVLMVLIVHIEDIAMKMPGWGNVHGTYARAFGYSAPDLFFVISGFIMSHITFSQPFEPRRWLLSRFIRIYPLFFLFCLLATVLWLINPAMTMGSGNHTWSSVLLSWLAWPQAGLPLLFIGWTLEHEIVFYATVFFTASVLGRERLLPVMLTLSALAAVRWWWTHQGGAPWWDWHLTSLFIWQFTLGVLVHHTLDRLARWPAWAWCVLAVLCGASAVLWAHPGAINEEHPVRVITFGLTYACVLIAWLVHERKQRLQGTFRAQRDAWVWAGDASYSLYLTHPFVLATVGKALALMHLAPWAQWLCVLVVTGLVLSTGMLVHLLLERPIIDFGRRLTRRPIQRAQTP